MKITFICPSCLLKIFFSPLYCTTVILLSMRAIVALCVLCTVYFKKNIFDELLPDAVEDAGPLSASSPTIQGEQRINTSHCVFFTFFWTVKFQNYGSVQMFAVFFSFAQTIHLWIWSNPKLCRIFFGEQKWIFSTHMHCYRNLNKFLHIFVFKKNHRTELYWCVCLKAISKSYRIVFVVSHHFDCMLSLILPRWCYTSCEP